MTSEIQHSCPGVDANLFSRLVKASAGGILRGGITCLLIHPLDTTRVLFQQAEQSRKAAEIAREIYLRDGILGFYKNGFVESLRIMTFKQLWRWPIIMELPSFFERRKVSPLFSELATGMVLSTLDGFITAPFNKTKLRLMSQMTPPSTSYATLIKEGWKGALPYWATLSVNWCTALAAQRIYRDHYKAYVERDLTLLDLTGIGVAVGVTVSVASAPLEYITTHVQGLDKPMSSLLPQGCGNIWQTAKKVRGLYRGFNLLTLSRLVHNITTVIWIDLLTPLSPKDV